MTCVGTTDIFTRARTHTHTHIRAADVVSDPDTPPHTSRRVMAGTLGVLLSDGSTRDDLCEPCRRAAEGGQRSLAPPHSAPF